MADYGKRTIYGNLELPENVGGVFLEAKSKVLQQLESIINSDWDEYTMHSMKIDSFDGTHHSALLLMHRINRPGANCALLRHLHVLHKARDMPGKHFLNVQMEGRCPRLRFGKFGGLIDERDPERGHRPIVITDPIGPLIAEIPLWCPKETLSIDIVLQLAIGCVRALTMLHSIGYVYRYVTPFHIALPHGRIGSMTFSSRLLTLTNMSLAHRWPIEPPTGRVLFVGSLRYTSIRAHLGRIQGPADDLISVVHMMAEWLSGRLPWSFLADNVQIETSKMAFGRSDEFKRLPTSVRNLYKWLLNVPANSAVNGERIIQTLQTTYTDLHCQIPFRLPAWMPVPMFDMSAHE